MSKALNCKLIWTYAFKAFMSFRVHRYLGNTNNTKWPLSRGATVERSPPLSRERKQPDVNNITQLTNATIPTDLNKTTEYLHHPITPSTFLIVSICNLTQLYPFIISSLT